MYYPNGCKILGNPFGVSIPNASVYVRALEFNACRWSVVLGGSGGPSTALLFFKFAQGQPVFATEAEGLVLLSGATPLRLHYHEIGELIHWPLWVASNTAALGVAGMEGMIVPDPTKGYGDK